MKPATEIPVLIVGGGPVGLAAALELSTHGVASMVVEVRESVSWQRPRAKTTSARTMEHFRRWGMADTIRAHAPLPQTWSDEVVFCTNLLGREVTRFDRCFGLDLQHDDRAAEGGQQISQPLLEHIMRETAAQRPSISLVTGATVTSLRQDDEGVHAAVRRSDGTDGTIRASYAIGCDGARSIVREMIGARLEGADDSRPNYNIVFRAETLAARVPHGDAVQYWVLDPRSPGVIGRLDLVDSWWCIAMGVNADAGAADPERLVRNLIGDHDARAPIEVIAGDPWRARMRLSDSYGAGRIFVAGDAAHLNPPWGGHGFNTGIGDAVNIGWKLAAILNGWASPSLTASYEAERRPVAVETIAAAAQNMRTLAAELADPRLIGTAEDFAAVRPAVSAAVRRTKDSEFHSLDLVLGTAYPASPIVAAELPVAANDGHRAGDSTSRDSVAGTLRAAVAATGDPVPTIPGSKNDDRPAGRGGYVPNGAPGHRLPHVWLSDTESLYDRLGPEFSLVGDLNAPVAARICEAAERLGIPLRRVAFGGPEDLFGAPVVLVRPDQHIAWRGTDTADPARLWRRVVGATLSSAIDKGAS